MYRPIVYYQTDSRWKNISYAAKGESSTIGTAGCGPTSMSMVLATWADKNVTPKTECAWALANGYKCLHGGTYYSYFKPAAARYGLNAYQLNYSSIYGNSSSSYHTQVKQAIDNNHLVIACMGKGTWTSSGHFVLVYNISGNTIYINDPYSSAKNRTEGNYSTFKKQVKYYFIIENPNNVSKDVDYDAKVIDSTALNCRKGPSTSYAVVKAYDPGTHVHIFKEQNNWGYTGEGWCSLKYLERLPDEPQLQEDELNMTKQEFIESLTKEEAYHLVSKALGYLAEKPEPEWSIAEGGMAAAKEQKIINDGEPERFVKRDELAAILLRLGLLTK